jgi:hypothetical protein
MIVKNPNPIKPLIMDVDVSNFDAMLKINCFMV